MERLILTARVEQDSTKFVAHVDSLGLEGEGDSLEAAQNDLVQVMRAWIETHDGTESLEATLAAAGFMGVDEDTELQLEFPDPEQLTEEQSGADRPANA
jgi:hypothetical protein